jgi:hypothetical protein
MMPNIESAACEVLLSYPVKRAAFFGLHIDLLTFDSLEREAKPRFRKSVLCDLAAHGYHTVRYDVIWDTAQNPIPELLHSLQTQLSKDDT